MIIEEYTKIAVQLAKNINGVWKIISDKKLTNNNKELLAKEVVEPIEILLLITKNYGITNIPFKNNVLEIAKKRLEEQKYKRQDETTI